MKTIIVLFYITILGFMTISAKSQIFVKNLFNDKQIEINTNERIKVVFETKKKFNGLYTYVVHGKNKSLRTGKLKFYSDSIIVVKSGLISRLDTIHINDIHLINKYNPYLRFGATILTSAGLVFLLTSSAIVDSPFIIGYALSGIWGITLIDDLFVYPYKDIQKSKWVLEIK